MKLVIIAASTILTGVVVSVSGVIGFVGLLYPILCEALWDLDRRLIPMAILGGGLFTMLTDLIARTIIAPSELPIGVVAAFSWRPSSCI
ncbi:MAG: iron chelate uptake ABC transporter family permease subunit [Eubacteriales bacterium]